ncbi:MAG: hypothetical protein A2Y81_07620 [Nitrospirae bacterium RBG_13_43_8]|nr:MAG: hypothetical protein A2Y81_07620 [Nitrospirae bacterium RBG_13_43_8]
MKKVLITIPIIFIIYVLLPDCHAPAQDDWNSEEGQNLQEKGKTREESKSPEEWKGLEEWKVREARKKLEQWKMREAQKRLEEWRAREAQKRLEEWKIQQERRKIEEWKEMHGWKGERYPYGHYYPGPRGGEYGQRKIIRTEAEARQMLMNYFSPQKATIGKIWEKGWFFEAEIRDIHNTPIDRVIIDKRTGRIRSIY